MVIDYVQGDSNPIKVLLFRGRSEDAGQAIDVSDAGVTVRANISYKGTFKQTIVCTKLPGKYKGTDSRSGLWSVDTAAPFNVGGKGGIIAVYPSPTTFNEAGVYDMEIEIVWPTYNETILKKYQVNARPQIA